MGCRRQCRNNSEFEPQVVGVLSSGQDVTTSIEKSAFEPQVVGVCPQEGVTLVLKKASSRCRWFGVLSSGGCHTRVEKSEFEPQVVGLLSSGGCHSVVGVLSSGGSHTHIEKVSSSRKWLEFCHQESVTLMLEKVSSSRRWLEFCCQAEMSHPC